MARAGIGGSVEGIHAVSAAVAAGRVTKLFYETGRAAKADVAPVLETAAAGGVEMVAVADLAGIAATDAPQGLVAHARPIPHVSLEAGATASDPAALVVLDHLEDPRNVGAVARSALAAGMGALVVPTRRAAPLGATAFKAAAGALERLPVAAVSSVADALARLRGLGVWLVGLDADGEQPLMGLDLLREPVALVIGAEGRGLSRLVSERVDVRVRIPVVGGVESLNAAAAASLAVFETARLRGWLA